MKLLNSVIIITLGLLFSTPILSSEIEDTLELPEEIKNLDSNHILKPEFFFVPQYSKKQLGNGFEAIVWIMFQIGMGGELKNANIASTNIEDDDIMKAALNAFSKSKFDIEELVNTDSNEWYYTKISFRESEVLWSGYESSIAIDSVQDLHCTDSIVRMPEFFKKGAPRYPREALQKSATGVVQVKALVDSKGDVKAVQIVKTFDSKWTLGINEAVIDAIQGCWFKPAMCGNEKIQVWITFPYEFQLSRE